MKKNKTFDYTQLMAHTIKIYKFLGFWRPDPDMKHKNLYHCYTAFWLSLSLIFISSQVIYMYNSRKSLKEVLAALYITLTFASILARQLTTYKSMNEFKEIIKELNRPLFQVKCQKHYEIADKTTRNQRLLYNICLFLGLSTDIFAAIFPLLANEKVILAKAWFPYDWTKPFNYFMTYIFQNAVLIWHTLVCYSGDMSTFTLLLHIGIQCDILCYTLNHLDDFYFKDGMLHEITPRDKLEFRKDMEKFSQAMAKNLVVCVRHHTEIIK
ncbi:uncharacterized protein LOC108903221 [Anoplophora glabripennis]|uniref:uncharacterized protein LOC108903221 n=1 Tax=Anoplophora glabripennis TaxID=217634 RepID=UPI000C771FF2|nr:uncharacterized protein LOC108903221 [Anoplophora glabripennis]